MASIVSMAGADVMQNIKVFVRCRPLKSTEKKNVIEVIPERKEVKINESKNSNERYNSKTFTFDNTFNADTTQLEVYRSVVEPLIEQVVMGYNCTVFAYGQTGTGKTYTMEGERTKDDAQCKWEDDPLAGIIPRALHQLFETLHSKASEHMVRVSFLELYNEELYDLLSPMDDTTKLKIFEDNTRKGSIIVGGLEEITVQTKEEIYEILKKGSAKRQTAATLLNACSSRSHTIFSVTVHVKENALDYCGGEDLVKIGKLNLVDLAGSENIGRSGAVDKRACEAGNINKSLLTLGRVITSLVDRTPHIPYRESKLTRILQESLGGRTKTSIIATISPNICDADDTLSTLEYAQKAKKITNKPEINQRLSKKTLLREYTEEIERLRRDLAACREKNGVYVDQKNFQNMEQQIKDQKEIEEKTAQIQALTEEMTRIQQLFEETKEELEVTNNTLKTTTQKLSETVRDLKETRTDRDEQKHLVEVHFGVEKKLSTQANQLLDVAEQSTDAVSRLHQKVDRQKDIETNNWTKTNEFKNQMVEGLQELGNLVSITTNSYNDSLDQMEASIQKNLKSVEDIAKEAQNKVVSFNEVLDDFKSQMKTLFTKDQIVSEQCLSLKDNNMQIQSNGEQFFSKLLSCVESGQKAIFEDLEKINQTVAQQRQDVEELVMKQNSQYKRMSKVANKSFDSIKKNLESVFDKQNEEMLSIVSQLEAFNAANAATHEAQDKQIEELENMVENQLKMLSDLKVNRIKAREDTEKANQEITNSLRGTSENRANSLAKLKSKFESFAIEIDCEEKAGLKLVQNIDELTTEKTQQLMNTLNDLNSKNTSLPNDIKNTINDSKEVLVKQCTESNALIDDSIKICGKQSTAKQTTLNAFDSTLVEKIEEQKVLMTDLSSNVKQISDCVSETTSEMTRMAQTMEKSQIRQIESQCKSFESFVKNDLVRDVPTGTTPQKTSYSFPKDLAVTSPHERILERFRLSRAANTALNEECESDILSDSSGSVKSFDSNASLKSNEENVKPLTDNQKRKKVGLQSKHKPKDSSKDKRTITSKPLANIEN